MQIYILGSVSIISNTLPCQTEKIRYICSPFLKGTGRDPHKQNKKWLLRSDWPAEAAKSWHCTM